MTATRHQLQKAALYSDVVSCIHSLRCQLQPTLSTRGRAVDFNEDGRVLKLSYMHIHYKGWAQFTSHSTVWVAKSHIRKTR